MSEPVIDARLQGKAREFAVRQLGSRPEGRARLISVKDASWLTLVRCSWSHTGFHPRGGTHTKEVVRWAGFIGERFVGAEDTKGGCVEFARWVHKHDTIVSSTNDEKDESRG